MIVAIVAGLGVGCMNLVDKTTHTPTNKDAMLPYVRTPDLELSAPPSKTSDAPLGSTYCRPDAQGNYDFATAMNGGPVVGEPGGTYFFGEGGGCIDRDIRDVWATAMNQPLMVWDDKGNSGTSQLVTPPKGVSRAFDVEYTHVEDGAFSVKVKWNMMWYHTIMFGTSRKPRRILINYRRYQGTKYIKYWEGSIILTRVSPRVTGVWIRNHIRASRVGETEARGGASDIIRKLRTGAPALSLLP